MNHINTFVVHATIWCSDGVFELGGIDSIFYNKTEAEARKEELLKLPHIADAKVILVPNRYICQDHVEVPE